LPMETPKLKVFISWAGERANAIGTGFHEFLPDVVNAVQPFMSGMNIDKGTRWGEVLSGSLQESSCAIVCMTRESMQSVWVAFEAGAVSRAAGGADGARSRIWTYLSGVEMKDLTFTPFAEYQATAATQDETLRLIRSINQLSPDPVSPETLKRRFDAVFWPNFAAVLDRVHNWNEHGPAVPQRDGAEPNTGDMLLEILNTLRSLQRDVNRTATISVSSSPNPRLIADLLRGFTRRGLDVTAAHADKHDNLLITLAPQEGLDVITQIQIPAAEVLRLTSDDLFLTDWVEGVKLHRTAALVPKA